jgi:hypothetical protein
MALYGINSGLPALPIGMKDEDFAKLSPIYRAISSLSQQLSFNTGDVQFEKNEIGSVDQLVLLSNHRQQRIIVRAGEALAYGQMLTLTVDAGKITAFRANAVDLSRPAHAVCDSPTGIAAAAFGDALFMSGKTAGIAGTVFGAAYYLSVDGAIQITPPVATGVISQVVGVGLGSAGFYMNIEPVGRRPTLVYKFNATTLRVLYSDGTFTDNAV